MEFDVNGADYYSIPIKTAQNSKNKSLSELYYWSNPFIIPGTSEEVMLCTVPIMDSNKNIYGICGFEISAMLFKLSYMPRESSFARMFCMLSPLSNHTVAINRSMFAGGYSVKDISEGNSNLTVKESHHSFTTYTGEDKNSYLGFHISTKLYPEESPFAADSWIIAVLVPKKDIVNYITRLNIILAWLLTLLVTIGIIISIVFSNNYLKPISQGIEIIKSADSEDMPKTNVQEIDDLIRFLTVYKKELNDKVERDKFQITVLEHFVEKTKMLSPAEHSVFNLYVKGLNAREIADEMFLSINTIKTHSKHIFSKLEISSREELLLYINMLKEIGQELK
jgi:DNA-binding CsgD family transcriptional regulator